MTPDKFVLVIFFVIAVVCFSVRALLLYGLPGLLGVLGISFAIQYCIGTIGSVVRFFMEKRNGMESISGKE